ncbi:hypothetical protein Bca101_074065 [Brassica carinata]
MKKLKYHEKKVLKKLNFLEWKREGGHREILITTWVVVTITKSSPLLFFFVPLFIVMNYRFLILELVFGQVFRIV